MTSELHDEFDLFKKSFEEYTKPSYSMFPLIELLAFWNARRAASSPVIELFRNSYIHLHCTEVDELCDWIEDTRVSGIVSSGLGHPIVSSMIIFVICLFLFLIYTADTLA